MFGTYRFKTGLNPPQPGKHHLKEIAREGRSRAEAEAALRRYVGGSRRATSAKRLAASVWLVSLGDGGSLGLWRERESACFRWFPTENGLVCAVSYRTYVA